MDLTYENNFYFGKAVITKEGLFLEYLKTLPPKFIVVWVGGGGGDTYTTQL